MHTSVGTYLLLVWLVVEAAAAKMGEKRIIFTNGTVKIDHPFHSWSLFVSLITSFSPFLDCNQIIFLFTSPLGGSLLSHPNPILLQICWYR